MFDILVAVAAVVVACWVGVAGASAATNVCTATGITNTIAIKYLGSGSYATYRPGPCFLLPELNEGGGIYVEISLLPKSQFQAQANERTGGSKRLSGLGSEALWFPNQATLLFKTGAHAVLIAPGGPWTSVPSKSKLSALAHLVYAHVA